MCEFVSKRICNQTALDVKLKIGAYKNVEETRELAGNVIVYLFHDTGHVGNGKEAILFP